MKRIAFLHDYSRFLPVFFFLTCKYKCLLVLYQNQFIGKLNYLTFFNFSCFIHIYIRGHASPYSKNLLESLGMKPAKVSKLIPNLNNKTNYILHHVNLKQYLSLGLKLTKIHRILAFDQSPWLKPHIDFNTERRKQAKNDFEKDFFKLMNNS